MLGGTVDAVYLFDKAAGRLAIALLGGLFAGLGVVGQKKRGSQSTQKAAVPLRSC